MSASPLAGRPVCQVGLVVRDIQRSARAFAELLGLPLPEVILTAPENEAHTRLRGVPTQAQARLAFFQVGSLSLELIEPVGGPSTWQEFLDTRGEGVHHLAFQVEDAGQATAALAERGIPVVQQGDYTGGCYTYLGSEGALAVILELLAPR